MPTVILEFDGSSNVIHQGPYNASFATLGSGLSGGLIENTPVVCGGSSENGYQNTCYAINEYEPFAYMTESRAFTGSIVHEDALWIFGGSCGTCGFSNLASIEKISLENGSETGFSDIPVSFSGCATTVKKYYTTWPPTLSVFAFLIGGMQDNRMSNKTWLYDFEFDNWSEGPSLIGDPLLQANFANAHGCSSLDNGLVFTTGSGAFAETLLFDSFAEPSWIQGKNGIYDQIRTRTVCIV